MRSQSGVREQRLLPCGSGLWSHLLLCGAELHRSAAQRLRLPGRHDDLRRHLLLRGRWLHQRPVLPGPAGLQRDLLSERQDLSKWELRNGLRARHDRLLRWRLL